MKSYNKLKKTYRNILIIKYVEYSGMLNNYLKNLDKKILNNIISKNESFPSILPSGILEKFEKMKSLQFT